MSAQSTIRAGQKMAEAQMIDTCVITRKVTITDPLDHTTTTVDMPVYSGKCKVQTYEPDSITTTSGGRPVSLQEEGLHVPVEAGPFEIGDVAVVEGYPQPYRVEGLIRKTYQTAQRLKVTAQANAVRG